MKRGVIVALIFLVTGVVFSQQKTQEELDREKRLQEEASKVNKDTTIFYGWKHAGTVGLNLSQVSFKDWVAGGENALSYTLWLQGASAQFAEKTIWTNSYKLAFGQTRLSDQGLRKTDDEIYFESFLIYKVGTTINPYAAATLRTQFAPGYTYSGGAETRVSQFFDPAYLTQSAGVAYQPIPGLTTRLGLALREVLTSSFPGYADDPATKEIEKTQVKGGMESVTDYSAKLDENIALIARLELFAPFNAMDKVIVRNDYGIAAKVSKYISTNLTVNILNDVNVSPRTQIKQALSLGITYSFL